MATLFRSNTEEIWQNTELVDGDRLEQLSWICCLNDITALDENLVNHLVGAARAQRQKLLQTTKM